MGSSPRGLAVLVEKVRSYSETPSPRNLNHGKDMGPRIPKELETKANQRLVKANVGREERAQDLFRLCIWEISRNKGRIGRVVALLFQNLP